jgi:hypothetical protein
MADPLPSLNTSGLSAFGQAGVNAPPSPALITDLPQWREAWRVRREHPRWAVLWSASAGQYLAYRRSCKQRDAIFTAVTPAGLAAQIEQAEQRRKAGPERALTASS